MTFPWQYDETNQVGTDYRDPAEVAVYDQRMQKLRDIQAESQAVKAALSVRPDSTIWEIGTGTGECALALASHVKRVFATDISPAMLECARQKAKRSHIEKEFSTFDWVLEGMMTRCGLKIVNKECKGFLSVYVCEKSGR